MSRIMVDAGGTYGFMAEGSTLRKVTLATGAYTNLGNIREFTALCYGGNSVLYGATTDEIGIINQTTGAFTPIRNVRAKVTSIVYKDTDEIWYVTGDALVLLDTSIDLATGTVVLTGDAVSSVTITNDGLYADGVIPDVVFSSTSGAGATGVAVMVANKVSEVTITEGGADYTAGTVAFVPDLYVGAYSYVKQNF